MSQKRARLRALAPFGLSILMLGAVVPTTAAATDDGVGALTAQSDPTSVPAVASIPDAGIPDDVALPPSRPLPLPVLAGAGHALVPIHAALPAPTTVAASTRVIGLAEKHLGARYAHGATGPSAFDCSGLVYRVFEDARLGRTIDGLQSAAALYAHFKALHKTSTRDPQPGDLVIFGHGSHVGIYIGDGKVIHAMISGVAITRVSAVIPGFTTYIHLGLTKLRLPVAGH